jgi:gliding motility-associated-like protein
VLCATTVFKVLVNSYRTEAFNQGLVQLRNPVSRTNIFEVCEGQDISTLFDDFTNFNCNSTYIPTLKGTLISRPNEAIRWQQIVYNTKTTAGSRIPNVSVNAVPVTDAGGADIINNYQDTRGVLTLTPLVVNNDPRRRSTLGITAPGGFGAGFPVAGDIFEVTIRYWNRCNPYDDPAIGGTPVDIINGDHPPIEAIALIRIIAAPNPPAVNNPILCETAANGGFEITANGVGTGTLTYTWYKEATLTTVLQAASTDNTFNPVTEGPVGDQILKAVTVSQTFTRYVTVTQGSNGCTSPPQTITIRIDDTNTPGTIAHPLVGSPITVCSGTDPAAFTSTLGATGGGPGGTFTYQWQQSTTSATAGFADISLETGATYDPPMLTQTTHFRRVVKSGVCADVSTAAITFIVNPLPTGVVSGGGNECSGTPAPEIIFTFTGASPFDFEYAINGTPQGLISNVPSPYVLTPTLGVYTLVSLRDNNSCVATSLTGSASSVATGDTPPSAISLTSSSPVCDDGVLTTPPNAILALAGGADNYDITFSINGNFYTRSNINSGVLGLITLSPNYAADWGGLPGSYPLDIVTIKSITTGCAGSNPFIPPSLLVVNSRPATPTGPVNSIACSSPDVGAPLNVNDPDPTNVSNVDITWSTGGTALSSYSVVGSGMSGSNNKTFTSATSAPATFFAFAINSLTGCISNNGIALSQQQDLRPLGVTAGSYQLNLCADNPSAIMAASVPGVGETGTWTLPGEIAYFQNFSGFANDITSSPAFNGWTRDVSDPQSFTGGLGYFSVKNNRFEGHDTNGSASISSLADVIWISPVIDISGVTGVQAMVDLFNNCTSGQALDGPTNADYVRVYYKLDNGTETDFTTNGLITGNGSSGFSLAGATATATAFAAPITGSTLQIFVKMSVNANNERIAFDNVTIKKSGSSIVIADPNNNTTTITNLPAPLLPGSLPITTQFKWSVTSPLGACTPTESVVDLRVNPLPTSNTVAPVLCDALPGNPVEALVDLTTYNSQATDGATVLWYSDAGRTIQITAPVTVSNSNNKFYWRAISTGCQNIGLITFTVRTLPSAIDQAIEICEDAVGTGSATNINLTSYHATISNNEAPRLLEWYEDDGSGGLGVPILGGSLTNYSITSAVSVVRLLHLKVIDTSSPTIPPCFKIADVSLNYKPRPTDNLIKDGLGNVVGSTFTICTSSSLVLLQVDQNQNPGSSYVWNIPLPSYPGEFEVVSNTNTFFVILRFPNALPGNPVNPSTLYTTGLPITLKELYGSCAGHTISTKVIVEGTPSAPVVTGSSRICVAESSVTFTASPATTATYTWSLPAGVTVLSADPTLSSINVRWGTTGGNVSVSYKTSTGCISPSSALYPIITVDRPNILSTNAISICNGQSVGTQYTLQSDIANTTYNWIVTGITGSVSGSAINDQATNVTTINQTLANTASMPSTVTYQVTPISPAPDNCTGPVLVLTVSLNVPVVNPGLSTQVCSREISGIVLSTDGTSAGAGSYKLLSITVNPSTVFEPSAQITSSSPFIPSGKLVPSSSNALVGAAGGIDFIKNDKFINTTSGPIIIRYEMAGVSPAPASCPGPSQIIELTVKPEPLILPTSGSICSGDAVRTSITIDPDVGAVAADQYELTRINNAFGLTAGGANVGSGFYSTNAFLQNDIFINTIDANSRDIVYELVPIAAGCRSDASATGRSITLAVNPAPDLAGNLSKTVCSGDASGIMLSTRVVPSASAAANNYNITNIAVATGLVPDVSVNLTFPRLARPSTELSADRFTNPTNAPLTVAYKVVPVSSFSCKGVEEIIVLTVEPAIKMTVPPNVFTCSDSPNSPNSWNILLDSNTTPTSGPITFDYIATSTPIGAITGFLVSQSSLPRLASIADKLVNNSDNVATVTYTITPKALGAKGGAGCLAVTPTVVTVTVEPKPKLSVSPSNQVVCEGMASDMTLSSTTIPGSGTLQFVLVSAIPEPASGLTRTSSLKTIYLNNEKVRDVWNNPDTKSHYVTYTFRSQIAGSLNCLSEDIVVILTVNPVPSIVAAPASATICSGDLVNITFTPDVANTVVAYTAAAPTVISGAGSGTGNLISQTLFYNSATPEVANSDGPVTVNYTITPAANNCTGQRLVVPVAVNPKPKILNVASTYQLCHGNSLVVPLSGNVRGTNYKWTVDNPSRLPGIIEQTTPGASGINQPMTNTTGVQATLTYRILAFGPGVNPNDCAGDQKMVSVVVAPQISASFQNPSSFICRGSSELLIVQLNGQAPFSFVYNQNDGITSTDITVAGAGNMEAITVTPSVTTIYTLKSIKDAFNCPFNITGQAVTITVYKAATASFTVGAIPLFNGSSTVSFTNNSVPLDNTLFRYDWTFGLVGDATPATQNVINPVDVTYLSPGTKNIFLKVTNIQGEAAGLSCTSEYSKQISISVPPLAASFDVAPAEACFPSAIQLKNIVATGGNGVGLSYEWGLIGNGKSELLSNLRDPGKVKVSVAGKYTITFKVTVPSTNQVVSATPKDITVYEKPVSLFELRPGIVYVPDTEMIVFNDSREATSYSWDFGDGGTSDLENPTYTYQVEGKYDITLIAKDDHGNGVVCADTLVKQVIARQGGQAKIPNAFTPNVNGPSPDGRGANGTFNDVFLPLVKGIPNDSDAYNLQIYDRWGNLIFESTSSTRGWDGYNKDGKLMPAGVYVYKLTLRFSDSQRTTQVGDVTMIH